MRKTGIALAFVALAATILVADGQSTGYTPKAQFCVNGGSTLCAIVPGNIGPDPMLDQKIAYNGINGALPTSEAKDVQTPFDILSWQTFVALNWTKGAEHAPPAVGLRGAGPRVWEGYDRVSKVFGNGAVQGNCGAIPPGMAVFSIASNGKGQPVAQNEEYIEAADGDPVIDVNGNWAIYERRVNNIEIAYLKAPGGNATWNLTTLQGQKNLIDANGTVNFPSMMPGGAPNGAIEIKAAWRILNPALHLANAARYFTERAMLIVAPDLVAGHKTICAPVELGLVAMHIIQKNPLTTNSLLPEWFWSTFEQVDNAPVAAGACDPTQPAACGMLGKTACAGPAFVGMPQYSFFNSRASDVTTNQPPVLQPGGKAFLWNAKQPYGGLYTTKSKSGLTVGTQVTRCWQIYALTQKLNAQWRTALHKVGSVFANYMLVGTQWGAGTTNTPDPRVPNGGVPNFLSNTIIETYLQTLADPHNAFGNGSCVACHQAATLRHSTVSSNLSFLPDLAEPNLLRRPPQLPRP